MSFRSENIKNQGSYKCNKSFIAAGICLFAVFAVLAYLFPYTGDDWSWGSNIGIRRLESFFDNYNGRYLGNLLVLALTRSRVLRAAAIAFSYGMCCFISCKYSSDKKTLSLLVSAILLFAMPKVIFTQAVVWTSGFANYVPSALMSVLYISLVRNITGNETPRYPKYMFPFVLLLGFSAALFMESVTVFNVILAAFVLVFSAVKFKKVFSVHIGFFVGSVLGAVCMFSNSVYHTIVSGDDGYRSIPNNLFDLFKRSFKNIFTICEDVAILNTTATVFVSVLLAALVCGYIKKSDNKKSSKLLVFALSVNVLCLCAFLCKKISAYPGAYDNSLVDLIVKAALMFSVVLYAVSSAVIIFICVKEKQRFSVLFPLCCVPVAVGPLVFVDPIGARCFFISQLLITVFAVSLFNYVLKETPLRSVNLKLFLTGAIVVATALAALFVSTFIPVYQTEKIRNEFAQIQSDNNEDVIVVGKLPSNVYLHNPDPHNDAWVIPYKRFYKLNEDAKLELMEGEAFYEYLDSYMNKSE